MASIVDEKNPLPLAGHPITAKFAPPRWLRNAHLQSVLPSLKWRRVFLRARTRALRDVAREQILDCGDGVRLMGLHSSHTSNDGTRPLVVLLHGWEGSADSLYVLSLGSHLFAQGFDVFRLNFRDHGPTHHLNRDIFHSCRIAEVVGAVRAIQDRFSPPSLHIAGFSLGGNFALRVAARAPAAGIRLQTASGICPVLSPRNTLETLKRGWFVYEKYFVTKWKNSLRIKQKIFPEHFDFTEILRLDNLHDMTEALVREHTDFPDLHAYLDGYAIVGDVLRQLEVESHIFLAADDPIISVQDVRALANPNALTINIAPHGGHCGFFDRLGSESWADRAIGRIVAKRS